MVLQNVYLSLILIIPIAGAIVLSLFEQLKKFLAKAKINSDILNHALANLVAFSVFSLAIVSVFVPGLRSFIDGLSGNFLNFGLLEAVVITIFSFLV